MSHTHKRWNLLRRIAQPRPAAERSPDPAEMGTAFGLDFSLADLRTSSDETFPDVDEGPDAPLRRLFGAPAR
jgi:hypothetical protein